MPKGKALDVHIQDHSIGTLRLDPNDRVLFVPDSQWIENGQDPALGLAFLRDPTARIGPDYRVLPNWFENLLPERGSRLRTWICQQQQIQERDSLSLIAALGGDLVGAVKVKGDLPHPSVVPQSLESDRVEASLRFSLAGMQLKLSMLESGDRFVFPAHNQLGQWIVKIPGNSYPDLPEVEATTMAWARASGLATPDFCVRPIGSLDGVDPQFLGNSPTLFAIQRFDRHQQARIHQEDFAQALEFAPSEKYGASNRGIGYDLLTKLVLDVCGREGAEDFVRRVAFLLASGNDDAHLKNWSFQWLGPKPQLSPCYDLVSTISWPEFGWTQPHPPKLALSFGKKNSFHEIDVDCLATFARRTGLSNAREVLLEALERARQSWPAIALHAPSRMREALINHWRRVPLLLHVGHLTG